MALEDIAKQINSLPIDETEKQHLLDQLWEEQEKQDNLHKSATRSAIAAILTRQLSHTLLPEMIKRENAIKGYHMFLSYLGKEQNDTIDFKQLFLDDTKRLEHHSFFLEYQSLRSDGKTVIEALENINRSSILWEHDGESNPGLPSNLDIIYGSRIGNMAYCHGRLNTILATLYLCEGEEYIKNNIKIADVVKDSLEEYMQRSPEYTKDKTWLQEYMNYEDPHSILMIEGRQIDPNILLFKQIGGEPKDHEIAEWNTDDVVGASYTMNYIMYLNTILSEKEKEKNTYGFLDIIRYTLNDIMGASEMISKLVIQYDNMVNAPEFLEQLLEKYPVLKKRFWVQLQLLAKGEIGLQEMEYFIHMKYGKRFSLEDILSLYT